MADVHNVRLQGRRVATNIRLVEIAPAPPTNFSHSHWPFRCASRMLAVWARAFMPHNGMENDIENSNRFGNWIELCGVVLRLAGDRFAIQYIAKINCLDATSTTTTTAATAARTQSDFTDCDFSLLNFSLFHALCAHLGFGVVVRRHHSSRFNDTSQLIIHTSQLLNEYDAAVSSPINIIAHKVLLFCQTAIRATTKQNTHLCQRSHARHHTADIGTNECDRWQLDECARKAKARKHTIKTGERNEGTKPRC